jgi:hypothetical protein
MKALSKGLIRGSIDQVERLVNITWVQPRVLSLEQVSFVVCGNMFLRLDLFNGRPNW